MLSLPIDAASAERLQRNGLETVFIEYSRPGFSSIEIDNEEGGRMAARFLLQKGYRRLAFLGEAGEQVYSVHPSDQRLAGFRGVIAEAGLDLPEDYVCFLPYSREGVTEQAGTLLERSRPPDAVFAASDLQAFGVIKAAGMLGMALPDDLAVIGFDNLDMADFMELTTINQELGESGRLAAELLMARVADRNRPPQNIRLPLTIVERNTT
jgi:LacI family transcriptional regulator